MKPFDPQAEIANHNGNGDHTIVDEAAELDRLERIIARGIEHFLAVGNALIEIRDREYYRSTHPTFEVYCRDRWNISRPQAYRLIESAKTADETMADPVPLKMKRPLRETHLRPLSKLPKEERQAAWDEAVETAPDGKITEKHVEEVVAKRMPPKPPKKPKVSKVPKSDVVDEAIEEVSSDPPDIRRLKARGIIPADAVVEVTEPEPIDERDEDEEPNVQAEQTDEEYLDACPVRSKLSDECRLVFDRDALLFRTVEEARREFQETIRRPVKEAKRTGGGAGLYYFRLTQFLTYQRPDQWVVCPDCRGTGRVITIGICPNCYERGYLGR